MIRVAAVAAAVGTAVAVLAGPAFAQAPPEITPNISITPSKTVTPWIYQMAVGAVIVGGLVLIGIAVTYLRFSPKFFGREEAARPQPPGARPQLLQRQERPAPRATPAPAPRPAPAPAPAPAVARTATAVAERPAAPAAAAGAAPTAPPEAEPAVQADAAGQAEAVAPEPAPAEQPAEEAAPAVAPEPAKPAAAPATPAAHGESAMDQETFDRVLKEQLDRGVDRRVAEGRARAAAVVAARKKAQG
jgi:hypothetical protein